MDLRVPFAARVLQEQIASSVPGPVKDEPPSISVPTQLQLPEKPRGKGRPSKSGSPGRPGVSCPTCGKQFNNSSALAKHKLTHSDERKYVCPICSKAFKRQDHLNGHMMTHRSKKPFMCKFEGCDKSYCDARSLRRHHENHHQNMDPPSTTTVSSHLAVPPGMSFPSNRNPNTTQPQGSYFQFDPGFQAQAQSAGDSSPSWQTGTKYQAQRQYSGERSPGYLNQVSPISPAVGGPNSPLRSQAPRAVWNIPGYNPMLDDLSPKPVECSICHRRFKNVPALNGHMRLHGGYFKKDIIPVKKGDDKEDDAQSNRKPSDTNIAESHQLQQARDNGNHRVPMQQIMEEGRSHGSEHHENMGNNYRDGPENPAPMPLLMPPPLPKRHHDEKRQSDQSEKAYYSNGSGYINTDNHAEVSLNDSSAKTEEAALLRDAFLSQAKGSSMSRSPDPPVTSGDLPALSDPQILPSLTPPTSHSLPADYPSGPLGMAHTFNGGMGHDISDQRSLMDSYGGPGLAMENTLNHDPVKIMNMLHGLKNRALDKNSNNMDVGVKSESAFSFSNVPLNKVASSLMIKTEHSDSQHGAPAKLHGGLVESPLTNPYPTDATNTTNTFFSHAPARNIHLGEQNLNQQHTAKDSNDPGHRGAYDYHEEELANPLRSSFQPIKPEMKTARGIEKNERKRHASAEADKFTSPKRALTAPSNLQMLLMRKQDQTSYKQEVHERRERTRKYSGDSHMHRRTSIERDFQFLKPRSRPGSRSEDPLSKSMSAVEANLFRNPHPSITSPRNKRKHRPEPLIIPPHVNNCGFQSRLRSPRLWEGGEKKTHTTPPPYTPPPMLSPVRSGSGLFWSLKPVTPTSGSLTPRFNQSRRSSLSNSLNMSGSISQSNSGLNLSGNLASVTEIEDKEILEEEIDQPPETDIQPHVNIGPNYQAAIPSFIEERRDVMKSVEKADIVFDPKTVEDIPEEDVQYFQDFACCAAVPGNGVNKEYALHLLHMYKGDVKAAILALMNNKPTLPCNHPLLNYRYQETDTWSQEEIEQYNQALTKCDKDFFSISKEIGTKDTRECVQFYYLWKKVCADEHKRLRIIRRKREQDELHNIRTRAQNAEMVQAQAQQQNSSFELPNVKGEPEETVKDSDRSRSTTPTSIHTCDYPGCSSTFNSKMALNGHIRIHGGQGSSVKREVSPSRPVVVPGLPPNQSSLNPDEPLQEFPCKKCGKVFYKVKSRSAHMKSHRVIDPDKVPKVKTKAAYKHVYSPTPSHNSSLSPASEYG
ncbi:unnamed protein product [Owenia fusiformis]|uniref:Uncharacterized protein n=1 Tax=Owenia fusiformis TaxID=6347 RepID=A0A8J1U3Y8_OWEFU|nr:unnamed protein product [Owenia fusiformis]